MPDLDDTLHRPAGISLQASQLFRNGPIYMHPGNYHHRRVQTGRELRCRRAGQFIILMAQEG
jgi:hypothetical protein